MKRIKESTIVVEVVACMMSPLTGCNRQAGDRRGVCDTCYQVAYDMVRDGQITFNELETAGLVRPVKRQSQKRILTAILARRS